MIMERLKPLLFSLWVDLGEQATADPQGDNNQKTGNDKN
jgi:hypothetical protein